LGNIHIALKQSYINMADTVAAGTRTTIRWQATLARGNGALLGWHVGFTKKINTISAGISNFAKLACVANLVFAGDGSSVKK
jgi:hypothetical protein